MSSSCLFCRIVRGEIPATIVAENDDCIAFRDIDPKAPTHVLVIPREHVPSLADAGQTVFHLHLHLLGGRRMSWPPG